MLFPCLCRVHTRVCERHSCGQQAFALVSEHTFLHDATKLSWSFLVVVWQSVALTVEHALVSRWGPSPRRGPTPCFCESVPRKPSLAGRWAQGGRQAPVAIRLVAGGRPGQPLSVSLALSAAWPVGGLRPAPHPCVAPAAAFPGAGHQLCPCADWARPTHALGPPGKCRLPLLGATFGASVSPDSQSWLAQAQGAGGGGS